MQVGRLKELICLSEAVKTPDALIENTMRHILLAYISPNNTSREHWKKEARAFLNQIRRIVGVGKKRNTNMVNRIEANWLMYYANAVNAAYTKERKEVNNPINYHLIPSLPMWDLDDFLEEDVEILVPMTRLGKAIKGGGTYHVF